MDFVFPLNENNKHPRSNEFSSRNITTEGHGKQSLAHLAPKIWNIVPEDYKSLTLSEFTRKIRSWKPYDCPCRLCKPYVKGLGFVDVK